MNFEKELREVKQAGEDVLEQIADAKEILGKAKTWGILDLFGGETLTSYFKRKRIKEANEAIRTLQRLLQQFQKELQDIHVSLPGEISHTIQDNVMDIWFDNVFTDLRVQKEIKQTIADLERLEGQILNFLSTIDESDF